MTSRGSSAFWDKPDARIVQLNGCFLTSFGPLRAVHRMKGTRQHGDGCKSLHVIDGMPNVTVAVDRYEIEEDACDSVVRSIAMSN